jgi:hypothetical protein
MIWRRKLLALWAALAALWMGSVFAQPRSYYFYEDLLIAFALLPPITSLLAGLIFVWFWQRHGAAYWSKFPQHLRRGLVRLYLVLAVPWVAWFGFQILLNGPRWKYLSHAFWSMLVMPIGGPIEFFVIAWVIAGFQHSSIEPEIQQSTAQPGSNDRCA